MKTEQDNVHLAKMLKDAEHRIKELEQANVKMRGLLDTFDSILSDHSEEGQDMWADIWIMYEDCQDAFNHLSSLNKPAG